MKTKDQFSYRTPTIPSDRIYLLPKEPVIRRGMGYVTRGGLKTGWPCEISGEQNRLGHYPMMHTGAFTKRDEKTGERISVDVLKYHLLNGSCIGDPSYDTSEYAVWFDTYTRLKALLSINSPNIHQMAEIALLMKKPVSDVYEILGINPPALPTIAELVLANIF